MASARAGARQAVVTALTLSGAGRAAAAAARVRTPGDLADHAQLSITTRYHTTDRVMIFAHFDPKGQVSEADWHLIDAFRDAGWATGLSTTMAVSHDGLLADCADRVDALCTRDNRGFDFGSWSRLLVPLLRADRLPERVVLLNNSVYGPVHPVEHSLELIAASGWAVAGMIGSREFRPHASSYFMSFDRRVMSEPRFLRWWMSIREAKSKWGTILAHELRWFGDFAAMSGGPSGVLYPPSGSRLRNPSSFTWAQLVAAGVPFVKKSLFGANYDRLEMSGWGRVLEQVAPDFDIGLIERDLLRLGLPVPATGLA